MRTVSRWVLGHRRAVVLTWLVVAIAGIATLSTTVGRLSSNLTVPGQPGFVADAHIIRLYGNGGSNSPLEVVVTAPRGTSPRVAVAGADQIFRRAASVLPGSRLADAANTGDAAMSADAGREQWGAIFTRAAHGFVPLSSSPVVAAARRVAPLGWSVAATGETQLLAGGARKGTSALVETLAGGVGALIVLVVVFASFIAVLPLLMAAVAIPTTFLAVLGLTHVMAVSFISQFLVALIGLGVAIDYSLLVVTRWRELRAKGEENLAAVETAMGSAGRSVVFSGITVAMSLLSLVVLPVPFLRSVGIAGFLIPLVSVAVALTLLPVLLASVGPRLDWPRVRHEESPSRPWSAWARLVLRHRRAAAVGAAALLAALVIPLAGIRLGEPAAASLAQAGPAQATLRALERSGVPAGILAPAEVLVTAGEARSVAARLSKVSGIYTAVAPRGPAWSHRGTAVVDVFPTAEPSTPAGSATTTRLVAVASRTPGVLGVGGAGAGQADFVSAVYGHFPLMLTFVALATLLLLTRAVRSLVLAAKALVCNLASVAAAYGVMVLVWQDGHGSSLIWSTPATGSITVWVPLMVFAFLFGLSMDYEVFVLSRVREEYDRTGSTDAAIEVGVARTGRLVTSAALILCLGFVAMASAPVTDLRIMATGLGAGIMLDALLIRSVLVPALLGVLGTWNWWLPSPLARLLRIEQATATPSVARA